MKKFTQQIGNRVEEICRALYEKGGVQAVLDYTNQLDLPYEHCPVCQKDMPVIEAEDKCCAVCGGLIY